MVSSLTENVMQQHWGGLKSLLTKSVRLWDTQE